MKDRTADPYRDDDVIDAFAPRFSQLTIGSAAVIAFLIDWWPLLPILAGQLLVGLVFGRRFCLPCVFYFEVMQPLVGEGPVEDFRPHRFASAVGVAVLGAASGAYAAGLEGLGWALGILFAALALVGGLTGLCSGCQLYRLAARLRRVRGHLLDRVDLTELGVERPGEFVVEFAHPLCTTCHELATELRGEGHHVMTFDVSKRPEIARRYGIAEVPVAVLVKGSGEVIAHLAP